MFTYLPARARPAKPDWIRTASDLLAELTAWAGKRVTASPGWPKTPPSLSVVLRRIAPQMCMRGVSITFLRTREKRFIEIISTKPPNTGTAARKCDWHRELHRRADSRTPGRSSDPRDGVTQRDAKDAGKHARV